MTTETPIVLTVAEAVATKVFGRRSRLYSLIRQGKVTALTRIIHDGPAAAL